MNINAFRKGDLRTSPTAKYLYNGKEFTSKEFSEFIKGSEEVSHDAEPANGTESTDIKVKKTSRKKRSSSPDTVRNSEGTPEQTTSDVQ